MSLFYHHYDYPNQTGELDAQRLAEVFAQGKVVQLQTAFGNVIVSLNAYTFDHERERRPSAYLVSVSLEFLSKEQVAMTPVCQKTDHVLPGAFGEPIDDLDESMREWVLRCADRALRQLRNDFEADAARYSQQGYLQILQTTVYLPDRWPEDATETEDKIWEDVYSRIECAVTFTAIDNSLFFEDSVLSAEHTGRHEGYAFTNHDSTVERFSLQNIRSRYFSGLVTRGVRVINLGSHYNGIYTTPIGRESGTPLFEYLINPALTAFPESFEADFPVSVSVRHDGMSGGVPQNITDPKTIRAVFEALRDITVLGEWPIGGHTDDYLNYYFQMADGRTVFDFEFQDGMLLDEWMGRYEITGFDALQRALPDPGM